MVPKAYETLTLRQCTGLIQPLMKLADAGFFLEPVDPEKLRIPDYFDVVKSPMDLSTVNRKLELGQYRSVDDFIFDVRLVWRNAYLYNKEGHVVHTAARRCELEFEEKLAALISSDAATRGSSASAGSNASEPAPERICTVLKQILRALVGKPEATHFRKPFDWNAAGCLNYPQIVSKPMDLGSASRNLDMVRLFFDMVRTRPPTQSFPLPPPSACLSLSRPIPSTRSAMPSLARFPGPHSPPPPLPPASPQQGVYKTVGEVRADLDLIWQNCIDFNGPESWIGKLALALRAFTFKKFTQAKLDDGVRIAADGNASVAAAAPPAIGGVRKRPPPPLLPQPPPPAARTMVAAADAPVAIAACTPSAPAPAAAGGLQLTIRQCQQLLQPLCSRSDSVFFRAPVDPIKLGLADYLSIVKVPMDLGTVQAKLSSNAYTDAAGFVRDVRLVWANARLYNPAGTPVCNAAIALSEAFEKHLKQMLSNAAVPPPTRPPPSRPADVPAARPPPPVPAAAAEATAMQPPSRPPAAAEAEPRVGKPTVPLATAAVSGGASAQRTGEVIDAAIIVRHTYKRVVLSLRSHPMALPFRQPVDWQKLGLHTYPDVIKQPMDLGTPQHPFFPYVATPFLPYVKN